MERPGQKRPDRVVCAALRARIQPDPGLRQRQPRASADAAADERVDRVGLQKSGQRPVSAAHRVDDRRRDDPPVGHIIELELRRPPEMAVDLPVIKRYRKPHKDPSRLCSCAK